MFDRRGAARALLLPAAFSLSGCIQTEIVGRYDRASCASGSFDDNGNAVIGQDVDCTTRITRIKFSTAMLTPAESAQLTGATAAAPAGSSKPKSGFDMPERAMKSYIEQLAVAKDENAAKALRTHFAAPIGASAPDTGPKDITNLTGTLNLTLMQAGVFSPGDRIERAMVEIRPTNTRIRNWTAARTAFDQIVEGALSSTQTESAELSASPAAALGLPFTGTGKVTSGASLAQNLTVSRRVEDTTPVVDYGTNTLTVVREGGAFRSLTGNTQVGLTLGVERSNALRYSYTVKAFRNGKNWVTPSELEVTRQSVLVGILAGDVKADVKMTYVIRHVLSGDGTSPERDDNVRFITMSETARDLALIPQNRITAFQPGFDAPSFKIVFLAPDGKEKTPLSVRGDGETDENGETLCLSDHQTALQMLGYLRKAPGDLSVFGRYELGIRIQGGPFTPYTDALKARLSIDTNCHPKNLRDELKPLESLKSVPLL
jgi:hypothetical protein